MGIFLGITIIIITWVPSLALYYHTFKISHVHHNHHHHHDHHLHLGAHPVLSHFQTLTLSHFHHHHLGSLLCAHPVPSGKPMLFGKLIYLRIAHLQHNGKHHEYGQGDHEYDHGESPLVIMNMTRVIMNMAMVIMNMTKLHTRYCNRHENQYH